MISIDFWYQDIPSRSHLYRCRRREPPCLSSGTLDHGCPISGGCHDKKLRRAWRSNVFACWRRSSAVDILLILHLTMLGDELHSDQSAFHLHQISRYYQILSSLCAPQTQGNAGPRQLECKAQSHAVLKIARRQRPQPIWTIELLSQRSSVNGTVGSVSPSSSGPVLNCLSEVAKSHGKIV